MGYHATHPSQEQFADVLLDLAEYVRPRLSIMDGVLAMEGDGPGASGTPRHAGVLLVSDSPLALDAAAAALIGLPLASNPVLLAAQRQGLRPSYIEGGGAAGRAAGGPADGRLPLPQPHQGAT